jgi:hypothetical protein
VRNKATKPFTMSNPLQVSPAAVASQDGFEHESRTPETGDEGREALPARTVGEGAIGQDE